MGRRGISLMVILAMMLVSIPAMAETTAAAGCGEGLNLNTVQYIFDNVVDKRIYTTAEDLEALHNGLEGLDRNGDGFLCWRHFDPNNGQDRYWGATDYVVTLSVDNRAVGQAD